MKVIKVYIVLLLLSGCSATSIVTFPDGNEIKVKAGTDEIVTITKADVTYIFDRRGRPTLFETLLTMMFMDTELKNKAKE